MADAAAVETCEEVLRNVTGERARELSILLDVGGLAITAPGPKGDLGGETRRLAAEETEPPGDSCRLEPMEDLADTGAAEVLIEPPGDRHELPGDSKGPRAVLRLGVERHTTTGRGREEDEDADEAAPWVVVGMAATGAVLLNANVKSFA